MGSLAESRLCRLCGENNQHVTDITQQKIILKMNDENSAHENHLSVEISQLLEQNLSLNLQLSTYPRYICRDCVLAFQQLMDFLARVNNGQRVLAGILEEEKEGSTQQQPQPPPTVRLSKPPGKSANLNKMIAKEETGKSSQKSAIRCYEPSLDLTEFTLSSGGLETKKQETSINTGDNFSVILSVDNCSTTHQQLSSVHSSRQPLSSVSSSRQQLSSISSSRQQLSSVPSSQQQLSSIPSSQQQLSSFTSPTLSSFSSQQQLSFIPSDHQLAFLPSSQQLSTLSSSQQLSTLSSSQQLSTLSSSQQLSDLSSQQELSSLSTKASAAGDLGHVCPTCSLPFNSLSKLLEHRTVHEDLMYKCEVETCDVIAKTKTVLDIHQAQSGHSGTLILEIGLPEDCISFHMISDNGDLSGSPSSVKSPAVKPSTGKKRIYSCKECERSFGAATSLKYHTDSTHAKQRLPCKYPNCHKTFSVINLLTRHLRSHGDDRPYTCQQCSKTFKSHGNLVMHEIKHTSESTFSCEECGQSYKFKTSLNSHMKVHLGKKDHKCSYCGKEFFQKGNLQEHLRVHTGEKPFSCQLCPRSFSTKSQLAKHISRHRGEKPFPCDQCPRRFLHADVLKIHKRRHTGEKPFSCRLCKKSFVDNWSLTKHVRTHTGEGKLLHVCKICGKNYSDHANLSRHMKTHKPGDESKSSVWNLIRDVSAKLPDHQVSDQEDLQQIIYVTYDKDEKGGPDTVEDGDGGAGGGGGSSGEEQTTTIDLTTKDGEQIRLVAPLHIDPITFAAEYLKDMHVIVTGTGEEGEAQPLV